MLAATYATCQLGDAAYLGMIRYYVFAFGYEVYGPREPRTCSITLSDTAVGCDLGCGLNEAVEVLDRQVPRRVEHVRATKWPQTQSLFTWT